MKLGGSSTSGDKNQQTMLKYGTESQNVRFILDYIPNRYYPITPASRYIYAFHCSAAHSNLIAGRWMSGEEKRQAITEKTAFWRGSLDTSVHNKQSSTIRIENYRKLFLQIRKIWERRHAAWSVWKDGCHGISKWGRKRSRVKLTLRKKCFCFNHLGKIW